MRYEQVFSMDQLPKVAVTVLIFKDGRVLLGRRVSDRGDGMFNSPGGHLEIGESFTDCANREAREEADLEISNVSFVCLNNVIGERYGGHYVVLTLRADWRSGEAKNCEPERCEGWGWYNLDQLPSPLTPATENGLKSITIGKTLFE